MCVLSICSRVLGQRNTENGTLTYVIQRQIVPAVWSDVVERLNLHGIDMQVFTEEVELEVKHYRVEDFEASRLREGHAFVNGGTPVPETCMRTYKKNDILITTDQPLGTLAVALLHPTGEGSLYNWGFFNAAFQSHECTSLHLLR